MFQSFRPQSYTTFKKTVSILDYDINIIYDSSYSGDFQLKSIKKSVSEKHEEKWDLLEKP